MDGTREISRWSLADGQARNLQPSRHADRIVIRQEGRVVAEHPRCYGRYETIYGSRHYVPILARKPGALRNGAPFRDWVVLAALERVRRKLATAPASDRPL